ncbi:hypothetical protein [Salinicoccus sp. HZC-1]|uniref:hypothetical protein n=1 Tax=Salinicoccus sp. HZC-1 TaxID=3385497 RepID=UPI00398ABEA5
MSNEVTGKSNVGFYISIFMILAGFIALGIHNLLTKESAAALWLSVIGLVGLSGLLYIFAAALIRQNRNKRD